MATGSDHVASPVTGTRKALTSRTRLPERDRERARGSAADGWGRAGSGRGEGSAGDGPLGLRRGGMRTRARERGFGPETAQPRGVPFFFFLFLISISFISFSFEQIIS